MRDDASNHDNGRRPALDLVEFLKRADREVGWLFKLIGRTGEATERRRLLDKIVWKLILRRFLKILLEQAGPRCERCLAHQARITLMEAGAMLADLGKVLAVSIQHGACAGCKEITRTFALMNTHSGDTRDAAS